jgi:acetyltransferase-like isoleucine patch superfamily enzyme
MKRHEVLADNSDAIRGGISWMRVKKKLCKTLAKSIPILRVRIMLLRLCNYRIGNDVFIGEEFLVIDDLHDRQVNLVIGDRAAISPRVTIVIVSTPNWSRIAPFVGSRKGPVTIGDDAWIGTGAVILPGITIGEGAVIGANAVVARDVDPHIVAAGVPAKRIATVGGPSS